MPRGFEDYENPSYSIAGRTIDISQMILSLSGVYSLDGLGRVIYADDFKDGIGAYQVVDTFTPGPLIATGKQAELGAVSMSVDVGTPGVGGQKDVFKQLTANPTQSVGVQSSIAWYTGASLYYLRLEYTDGVISRSGILKVDPATRNVSYYSGAGYVVLTQLPTLPTLVTWVPLKVVLNLADNTYRRIIIGNTVYDVDGILAAPTVIFPGKGLGFGWTFDRSGAVDKIGYIGHVLVTLDDP